MKSIFFCILTFLAIPFISNSFAPNPNLVTAHYTVHGVCEQCKKRIENASYIKGVKNATWTKETEDLTVTYDSIKTNPDLILKSIASAGHDADKYVATEVDYNKLPKCCKYKTITKKH